MSSNPPSSRLAAWLGGARPRTLPAAVAPVLVGTGAAALAHGLSAPRALGAAAVALALQVGVNFANDYSDGVRGTDTKRVGPTRLVASGAASPRAVKLAAFGAFGVAGLVGLGLVATCGQWWLLAVGAAAIAAAWFYTGGTNPYGYRGLGEAGVFVFFGLVAVTGTSYVQALAVPWQAWVGACVMGLLACALLMVNNLRDIPTDAVAGKRTLAVRLGDARARMVYGLEVWAALGGVVVTWAIAVGAGGAGAGLWACGAGVAAIAAWAVALVVRVMRGARGPQLLGVLQHTGLLELATGVVLGAVIALS